MKMCNFSVDYIRWCGMHTLNLGLVQTMLGSTIRVLLDSKQWGDVSDDLQLKAGFLEFASWARRHKIPYIAASSINFPTEGYIFWIVSNRKYRDETDPTIKA